jgi:hypothetical protein
MPATTSYDVDLLVELAIARPADAGLWGHGLWDVACWGDSDTPTGDWIDVTCDVLDSLRLTAGSNTSDGVTRRWESASASFVLAGAQWDPWNGPYTEVLGDRTPVRVSWRPTGSGPWGRAFTGFIATRGYNWRPGDVEADVACVDGTSILVASDALAQAPAGAGELASARVRRIAETALWPGGYDIAAGGTALQATTLDDPAWDELLAVADTDLAIMWVRRDGRLGYLPRGRVTPPAPWVTIAVCEDPGEVGAMTLGLAQPSVTRNRVAIARRADPTVAGDTPVPAQLEDRESIARYQAHDYKRTDLWNVADSWSAIVAQAVMGAGAWPSPAPGELLLDSDVDDPLIAWVLLGVEPNLSVDVVDLDGTVWREAVVGWDVQVTHDNLSGVLHVEDVTRWTAVGKWGTAVWGVSRWGIGGI